MHFFGSFQVDLLDSLFWRNFIEIRIYIPSPLFSFFSYLLVARDCKIARHQNLKKPDGLIIHLHNSFLHT